MGKCGGVSPVASGGILIESHVTDILSSTISAFMLPLIRPHLSLPYLARESDLEKLELPAERKMDFVRCEDPTFDQVRPLPPSSFSLRSSLTYLSFQFIGAEDPRYVGDFIQKRNSTDRFVDRSDYSLRTLGSLC